MPLPPRPTRVPSPDPEGGRGPRVGCSGPTPLGAPGRPAEPGDEPGAPRGPRPAGRTLGAPAEPARPRPPKRAREGEGGRGAPGLAGDGRDGGGGPTCRRQPSVSTEEARRRAGRGWRDRQWGAGREGRRGGPSVTSVFISASPA